MAYLGENRHFSFRSGCCEALTAAAVTAGDAAALGRTLTRFFTRFSVGCDGFEQLHILYALCSGISECGMEVYVCENTDMPSFRFGSPLLSADCAVFVSGSGSLKLSFFDRRGCPLPSDILRGIMKAEAPTPAGKAGKINVMTSFRSIYANNLSDCFGIGDQLIPAGISCGSRSVRSLWLEFFSGESDSLVFQISDDGQRVNAYSTETGFISAEKLALAYCMRCIECGKRVLLPDSFHYAAEQMCGENGRLITRFDPDKGVPDTGGESRFLKDPLYMCISLASDMNSFSRELKRLPRIASAGREISLNGDIPEMPPISDENGRIIIRKSGKNRISLLAQTFSSETAAELCSQWAEKLRIMDRCGFTGIEIPKGS